MGRPVGRSSTEPLPASRFASQLSANYVPQHHRQALGSFRPRPRPQIAQGLVQNFAIKKHQCIEGLILSRRGDVAILGQMTEETGHFRDSEAAGMSPSGGTGGPRNPVMPEKRVNPMPIGSLGPEGIVMEPHDLPDLFPEGCLGIGNKFLPCRTFAVSAGFRFPWLSVPFHA